MFKLLIANDYAIPRLGWFIGTRWTPNFDCLTHEENYLDLETGILHIFQDKNAHRLKEKHYANYTQKQISNYHLTLLRDYYKQKQGDFIFDYTLLEAQELIRKLKGVGWQRLRRTVSTKFNKEVCQSGEQFKNYHIANMGHTPLVAIEHYSFRKD